MKQTKLNALPGYIMNPILNADSYKASQYLQYPKDTGATSSYIEPRGGKFSHVVCMGIQRFVKKYLQQVPTVDEINRAARIMKYHGEPFNYDGWMQLNKLGYFPLKIEAVKEGSVIPVKNAIVQVMNTHSDFAWLTGYVETALLRSIWYPSTVATLSASIRQTLKYYGDLTGVDDFSQSLKLHNFGDRGATSTESAEIAGIAHLTSFYGTDSLASLEANEYYYNANIEDNIVGLSIPASEHSTITSWGSDNEKQAFINMIKKFGGQDKIYACVSDSYNIWNALELWKELEPTILEHGGTLVIRPDSGDPIQTPINVVRRCLELFGYDDVQGSDGNTYKVLPKHIRVIQGDGVNHDSIKTICQTLVADGISIENIAFGMGGELVQKINRDTMKWAMKMSYIRGGDCDEFWGRGVFKNPCGSSHWNDESTKTDKASKSGILKLVQHDNGDYETLDSLTSDNNQANLLELFVENGIMYNEQTLNEIRQRVQNGRHLIQEVS